MFTKWKYKVWKHLTKELVNDELIKNFALESVCSDFRGGFQPKKKPEETSRPAHNDKPNEEKECAPSGEQGAALPKIIALQGIYYSGSSTLVGLFQEFDNMRVVGYSEPSWAKKCDKATQSECCFFNSSGFIEMIQSFRNEPPEVINYRVRRFVYNINSAYAKKGIVSWENLPDLYNDTFREITQELLLSILDLDDATREFMRKRQFPHGTWENNDATFDSCNFTLGEGKRRYLAYRFADISEEEFSRYVSEYLEKFFLIISGKEYVVYDQFLPRKSLEVVNKYLRTPIKQIVVIRDPRDQFLSADRRDITWLPRTAQGFINHNIDRLKEFPADNPDRMIVRFEDLVLNYEQTKNKVMAFVGLDPKNHVAPKSVFDPSISVVNVGGYRHYYRQEFMKEVEEGLKEYCFYPEREQLSREAMHLLMSSGNWDDKLRFGKSV